MVGFCETHQCTVRVITCSFEHITLLLLRKLSAHFLWTWEIYWEMHRARLHKGSLVFQKVARGCWQSWGILAGPRAHPPGLP